MIVLILALFVPPLAAQPVLGQATIEGDGRSSVRPKYVRFDFTGNPEQALADFLKTKDGRNILQNLQNQILKAGDLNAAKELIEKQKATNPWMRKFVEKLLEENPHLPGQPGGDIVEMVKQFASKNEQNRKLTEKFVESLKGAVGKDGVAPLEELLGGKRDNGLPSMEELELPEFDDDSIEDRFAEWLRERLSDDRVRDWWDDFLKDTPDLQDAVGDLIKSLQGKFDGGDWMANLPKAGFDKWNFDFTPPKLPFGLGDMPRLPNLKMPALPRLNLPMPRLGRINLPGIGNLSGFGGPPRMPGVPGAPAVSGAEAWLKIALVVLAIVAAWWMLRKVRWATGQSRSEYAALLAALPTTIRTRTELRQAFDALALMRIGETARPWNHLLIARHLAEGAPTGVDRERAARALAHLYELARYTAGDEQLTPDECKTVRESIDALTRGAAPAAPANQPQGAA